MGPRSIHGPTDPSASPQDDISKSSQDDSVFPQDDIEAQDHIKTKGLYCNFFKKVSSPYHPLISPFHFNFVNLVSEFL